MDTHSEEREKLRSIQAVFEKAVENNTIDDLKPHIDPQFSFVSFTDRAFTDFTSFSEQWHITRKDMVGSGKFSTTLDPQPAIFIGDTAVCFGNAKNNMIDSKGRNFDFTSNWTVVFKRNDGEWKVLRAHNSLDPFFNPMLKQAVKTRFIQLGLLAFVLGGALCSSLLFLILN